MVDLAPSASHAMVKSVLTVWVKMFDCSWYWFKQTVLEKGP